MAKLTRKTQKIFAGNADSDQITAFGTAKSSSPTYTTDVDAIQTTTYTQGWTPSLMSDLAPYLQDSNGLWYAITRQLAYLYQQGIAEWDSNTTYYIGSIVSSGQNLYLSTKDNNTGNAVTNINYWKNITSTTGMPIGTIFAVAATSSYVPENALPCDGTEYSSTQFPDFYTDYLSTSKISTCSYTTYASNLSTYGQCGYFGLDTTNSKFKVPYIKDGSYLTQSLTGNAGQAYNESLPDHNHTYINTANSNGNSDHEYKDGYVAGYKNGGGNEYPLNSSLASAYSSIYQSGAKVQGDNVRMKYFVVVSNATINESQMDWSKWASSLVGKLNTDHSNDTKPYLKTTYVSGTSGYNIWSNGYCEQWGAVTSSDNNPHTYSFLKTFSNIPIILVTTIGLNNADISIRVSGIEGITVSNFTKFTSNTGSGFYWKASGYLADGQY